MTLPPSSSLTLDHRMISLILELCHLQNGKSLSIGVLQAFEKHTSSHGT